MQNEPVVTVGMITAAVMAVLVALVSLNVFNLDAEQLDAIENALSLVLVLAFPVSALIARQFVTPVSKLEK